MQGILLLLIVSLFYGVVPHILNPNPVRLDASLSVPHHYDVALTIDKNSFSVDLIVELTVLSDTKELQLNANGVNSDWTQGRLVALEGGKEYHPNFAYTVSDNQNEILFVIFSETIPGPAKYNLYFTEIVGDFGSGLIEEPQPSSDR